MTCDKQSEVVAKPSRSLGTRLALSWSSLSRDMSYEYRLLLCSQARHKQENTGASKAIHLSPARRKAIFLLLGLEHAILEPKSLAPGRCLLSRERSQVKFKTQLQGPPSTPSATGYCGNNVACARPQDKRSTRSKGRPVEAEQKGNCLSRKLSDYSGSMRSTVWRANRCLTVYLVAPKLG